MTECTLYSTAFCFVQQLDLRLQRRLDYHLIKSIDGPARYSCSTWWTSDKIQPGIGEVNGLYMI